MITVRALRSGAMHLAVVTLDDYDEGLTSFSVPYLGGKGPLDTLCGRRIRNWVEMTQFNEQSVCAQCRRIARLDIRP